MNITLHWWMAPLGFFLGYLIFGLMHIRRRSPFDIVPGLLSVGCLLVTLSFLAGHYL